MEWYEYALLIVAMLAAFSSAVYVWRKGWVNADALGHVAEGLDSLYKDLTADGDECLFDRMVGYAAQAVRAAEQMCKANMIQPEARKQTAMDMMEDYAMMDGVALDEGVAGSLIEAQVALLPPTKTAVLNTEERTTEIAWEDASDEQVREVLADMGATKEEIDACKDRAALDALADKFTVNVVDMTDDQIREMLPSMGAAQAEIDACADRTALLKMVSRYTDIPLSEYPHG